MVRDDVLVGGDPEVEEVVGPDKGLDPHDTAQEHDRGSRDDAGSPMTASRGRVLFRVTYLRHLTKGYRSAGPAPGELNLLLRARHLGQSVAVPLRLFVVGSIGIGVSLYLRAAHRQLLGWKSDGDTRAGRWEDTGELGAWKPVLLTSVALTVIGLIWGAVRFVTG